MKKTIFIILLGGIIIIPIPLVKAMELQATNASAVAAPKAEISNTATATASTATETYKNTKDTYTNTVTEYKSIRQDWLTAKGLYQKSRSSTDFENALEKAKAHMLKVEEVIITYLTAMKTKVENMENIDEEIRQSIITEIDSDINWLQAKQAEINNATTKEDLTSIVTAVKNYWQNIKPKAKRYLGHILVGRINAAISKLENARDTVNNKINLLKENGQDTAKLESLVTDFNSKIDLAKGQLENAKAKFSEISSLQEANSLFKQGKDFISSANKYLREAWQTLQSIITELKKNRLKSVELSGTGTIHIEGQGTTTLAGNGTVEGTTDTGATAVVTDKGGDALVDTQGQGGKEILSDNQTRYTGFGSIKVTGTNIEVQITGSTLNIDASGTGTVSMKGTGTYQIGGGETQDIPAAGIVVSITPA